MGDASPDSIARCPYKMPVPWRCEKAAEVGDLEILRNWLEREPRDLNEPTGGQGDFLLLIAVRSGHTNLTLKFTCS